MTDYFDMRTSDANVRSMSNLALAHVGDAVYELMVRAWVCTRGLSGSNTGLHAETVKHVSAPAQAEAAYRILPELTDEERAVYKRGKNAHVSSVPHRATIEQYHAATGLEALFGYLYLKGRTQRLNELFAMITEERHDAS